jgi:hypothetical protein
MKKLMVIVAALAMITSSAYAADWNFYGSARIQTFITDTEVNGTDISEDIFDETMQGNSRIGAKVKVSDELTGRFEYGTGVNVRVLYGEWNFGAGSFLVGQTYTPLNLFYSNQVYGGDTDLLAYGGVYSGRNAMLRLKFGDFQIAAVDPATTGASDVTVPAIEAKYSLSLGVLKLAIAGGYQTYEVAVGDVDTWVVALGGSANFGAAYVNAQVYTGQNAGSMMWIDTGDGTGGTAVVGATEVIDNDNLGWLLVAGYKVNDMFSLEAGYGWAEAELDGAADSDEVSSYYIQATVGLAPGVFFVPEIGVIDFDEDGQTQNTYYGVKWQINF